MEKHDVLNCGNYKAIQRYLKNAHWTSIVALKTHWSKDLRRKWYHEYIREGLKPSYRICWWWNYMRIAQCEIGIVPRLYSEWPDARIRLIDCLFVFKGSKIIISKLACRHFCLKLYLCPTDLVNIICEFIGEFPTMCYLEEA